MRVRGLPYPVMGMGSPLSLARAKGGGVPSLATIERLGALGDSITRSMMAEWASSVSKLKFTNKAWAFEAARLSGRKFWFDPAACEGYSGERSDQILAHMLAANATTSFGPTGSKVTIPYGVRASGVKRVTTLIGTNDLTFYAGGDPSTFIGYYNQIWDVLVAAGITPIVLSLLPRNDAYASAVPTWNAAIQAAAAARGFQFVDIYTPCATGTAWKTGYDWANGVEDATFLHPGADGCKLGIAPTLTAAIISTQTKTPHLVTSTQAELVRNGQAKNISILSTGWDGLFSSAANWAARYEPLYASTRSVNSGGIAEYGKYLQVVCGPQAADFYSDTQSPAVSVTIGQRYGLMARVKYDAGKARPTTGDNPDFFGLQIVDASYNHLTGFSSGGVDAYSIAGASLAESDIWLEFVAPVASVRLFWSGTTVPASAGSNFKISQAALVAL